MLTINNNNLPLVDYRSLIPIQKDLKDLSEKNYKKLLKSLNKYGLFVPFFVWQDDQQYKVVDGTQRLRVLNSEGIEFENTGFKVPCLIVHAKTDSEAKEKILLISSQYGKIQADELQNFIIDAELPEAEVLDLVNFDALPDFFKEPLDDSDKVPCPTCGTHVRPEKLE